MRVVKCLNMHFYDADKYPTCPQCGAAKGSGEPAAESTPRKAPAGNPSSEKKSGGGETFGVFRKKPLFKPAKKETSSSSSDNYDKLKKFNTNTSEEVQSTVAPPEPPAAPAPAPAMNANSLLAGNPAEPAVPAFQPAPAPQPAQPVQPVQPVQAVQPAPAVQPVQAKPAEPEPETSSDSLLDEIKKVSSDNEGKTVGFFSSGRVSTNESAEAPSAPVPAAVAPAAPVSAPVSAPAGEPVVGWVVCIKGGNIGQSFNVYAGKNSIGRGSSNRVNINMDKSVSREKHSLIIYDPKNRDFYIQPGDSSGLTYVNGDLVLQPTKLEKKAEIEVGNTKLLLIPLCGEDFTWEDYL